MAFVQKTYKIKNIPNLSYGINDLMEAGEILENEMADCENYTVDEASIRTAPGYVMYQTVNKSTVDWGIYHLRLSNGTQKLLRQTGTKLQYDNGSSVWTDCILPTTGSPAASISLPENQPTFVTLNDICVYSDGVTYTLSSTDGITWTNQPTLPKGILINNGKNRILYIENATSKIWYSDLNTPLTVQAASWQFIDPNNGQNSRGAITSNTGSTLFFKESQFYEIDDVSLGMIGVNPLGEVRLASHHTICQTENSIILMAVDGIYEYMGGVMRKISGRISMTGRNSITNWNLATASYINGEYRVSIPDADVSLTYNCQEYVVHKGLMRQDSEQPYVITRNRRYFGCYGIEYATTADSRRVRLYAGGSVATTSGSPALTNCPFVYINVYKDDSITQGLNGAAQSGYFVTKHFTDNIPYYVKKFKKLFYELNLSQDTIPTFSYRFSPYDQWTDVAKSLTAPTMQWLLEDGSSGGFSEGYGFSAEGATKDFMDIENNEKPRGIQFKITTSSINDIIFLGLAYSFRPKPRFK